MGDYSNRPPPSHTNGHSLEHKHSRPELSGRRTDAQSKRAAESGFLAPARVNDLARKDSSISDTGSAPDSLLDLYGTNRSGMNSIEIGERRPDGAYGDEEDLEHSRWIHRDKLARIENQELQAAGIILPRTRAASKSSRREHSRDQQSNGIRSEQAGQKRQRIGSSPTEGSFEDVGAWDLRLPEEVAEDPGEFYRDISGGVKGVSRIPVSKASPIPIPMQHLERETPLRRNHSGGWVGEEEGLSNPKSRGRSGSVQGYDTPAAAPTPAKRLGSDNSPTKKKVVQKGSTPSSRTASTHRPKTRSGPGTRDTSGTQRPTTRSGDLSNVKPPVGDPPWLSSMYKPDPRLPPDQQLLPTVAKRLQQEQWEKEGKFGNAYDTSFRPLNDDELPEPQTEPASQFLNPESKPEQDSEWPLRGRKSPAPSTGRPGTAGGYSTIPKISTGIPHGISPITSPSSVVIRADIPSQEEKKEKAGCGCCVVM